MPLSYMTLTTFSNNNYIQPCRSLINIATLLNSKLQHLRNYT